VDRAIRDLQFNPDRELSEPIHPEARKLIRAKQAALEGPIETRRQRVARFREIRAINEALQDHVRERRRSLQVQRSQTLLDLEWNGVGHDREFPFVVHSARRLRDTMGNLQMDLG
jgi:hypothetical protein